MTTRFLFLCDHSAGKSLLAATYFRAAATRLGLDVEVDLAGPDPDEHVMPNVAAALAAEGHAIGWEPRRVTAQDLTDADQVINIGCDLDSLPEADACDNMTTWDVPMLSVDFDGSVEEIRRRADALAVRLAG